MKLTKTKEEGRRALVRSGCRSKKSPNKYSFKNMCLSLGAFAVVTLNYLDEFR
jgi:hypothetical protein